MSRGLRRWVVISSLSATSLAAAAPVTVPGFPPLTEERIPEGKRTAVTLRDPSGAEVLREIVGPNSDGDLVRALSADAHGIRRWQQTSGVARCDGTEPLFLEHLDPKTRVWIRDPLPVPEAPTLPAHTAVPGPPPRHTLRFSSGSTDGVALRADALGAPRALDDGHDATALPLGEGASVRGAFFTALAPRPIDLTSIRVGPPAGGARLPAALVLIGGTPAIPRARLPLGATSSWFVLPAPLRGSCVTFVVDEPENSRGRIAIGEITLHAADDAPEAMARLAESVAHDGNAGDESVLEQDPASAHAILAALPTATPTGRRRLLALLARHAEWLAPAELQQLIPLVATAHEGERASLVQLLSALADTALDPLVQQLSDPSQTTEAKVDALHVLARVAQHSAVPLPYLIDALADPALAATARSELAHLTTQAAVVQLLADRLASLPSTLVEPSQLRLADGLVGALAAAPQHAEAIAAIDRLGAPVSLPFALAARVLDADARLDDPARYGKVSAVLSGSNDAALRRVAVSSLPDADVPSARLLYSTALGDPDERVRERATQRLVDAAVATNAQLTTVASDRWPQLRTLAYAGLKCAGAPDIQALLLRRVFDKRDADPDARARTAALAALARCPGIDADTIARAVAKAQPPDVREEAAALLGERDPSILPLVTKTLDKVYARGGAELPDTAVALLRTMGRLGARRQPGPFDDAALTMLRDSADDPLYPSIRIAAIDALGRGCPVGTRHVLERAAHDPEPAVVRAVTLAASHCAR
ncbi:MAG: hypothetical protein ABI321_16135 [Polyangia bacterium]